MKRIWVVGILFLAFCGLADSAYLAQHELNGTPLICNIQAFSGCNIVADSPYSRIFGVPLAELGVIFYGTLFLVAALELVLVDRFLRRLLQVLAFCGALASVYFVAVQIFFIGAFCIYCAVSAAITLFVFIFASFIEAFRPKKEEVTSPILEKEKESFRLKMPPTI